jgi:hypothetical protein
VIGGCSKRKNTRGVERYIPPPPAHAPGREYMNGRFLYFPYVPFLRAPYTHEGSWGVGSKGSNTLRLVLMKGSISHRFG